MAGLIHYRDPDRVNDTPVSAATPLPVTSGGSGASSDRVQGAGPAYATNVSDPVIAGGLVNTGTPTAATTGQAIAQWMGGRGSAATFLTSQDGSNPVVTWNGDASAGFSGSGLNTRAIGYSFSGSGGESNRTIVAASPTGVGIPAFAVAPHSVAGGAIAPTAITAVAASQIAKASAGNLYGFNVTTGATAGYIMLFNSTTVPADGAVTPVKIYQVAANTTTDRSFNMPLRFSTGIVVVFSSTGPFTKTASATAFIESESV